jgi:fructose-1,6-bisphosphatase I
MAERRTLETYLKSWEQGVAARRDVAITVIGLAAACLKISKLLARGALAGPLGTLTGKRCELDPQREIDVVAHETIVASLAHAPVALLISEERDEPLTFSPAAPLVVAVDPMDGATNADTNAAIGTIFSILPNATTPAYLAIGRAQLAAGFVIYGPQTLLALTVGSGTVVFTLNPESGTFELTSSSLAIPSDATEFAINASNHWHWDEPIRTYVDDCLRGRDGPRRTDYNMRWTGSFVAEIYRILVRGGIYLYPGDRRKGYRNGRLRLMYEANPAAWLVEQAGGAASTGSTRILDVPATSWHQRTPIVIGSRNEVAAVDRIHQDPHAITERSPLFGRRGLFRV